jgi:hypothetical protein
MRDRGRREKGEGRVRGEGEGREGEGREGRGGSRENGSPRII